ncbi:Chorismate synthase [Candidatus Gugararchaeum adminiculabundum]|nr:Chorismate synthase [Candidatus Gugararchaeum adminiculabundum]
MNTLGTLYRVSIFGESHGACVGALVDGAPAGIPLDERFIQNELNRRKPGKSKLESPRKEEDKLEILSGVFKGKTTGAPVCMLIRNKDADSSAYERIKAIARPGHTDWVAHEKFGGFNDYRGSGIFSGRLTAATVMGGALAKLALRRKGISISSRIISIGGCENPRQFDKIIEGAKQAGDSVSASIECTANGLPAGLGEPRAGGLDAELARAILAIPAVKGIKFGNMQDLGSINNDEFAISKGRIITKTNNSGGVLGGISTGMPLVFTVDFKPTPSIGKKQKSVNFLTKKETELQIGGRHDVCVGLRAPPVVEAATACVLLDLGLQAQLIPRIFK